LQLEVTDSRVALAQIEERRAGRRQRLARLETDLTERTRERERLAAQQTETEQRWNESLLELLRCSNLLAEAYAAKEEADRHLLQWNQERSAYKQRRQELNEQVQTNRNTSRQLQQEAHAKELEVKETQHLLELVCKPLQDDYQLELAALYREQVEA